MPYMSPEVAKRKGQTVKTKAPTHTQQMFFFTNDNGVVRKRASSYLIFSHILFSFVSPFQGIKLLEGFWLNHSMNGNSLACYFFAKAFPCLLETSSRTVLLCIPFTFTLPVTLVLPLWVWNSFTWKPTEDWWLCNAPLFYYLIFFSSCSCTISMAAYIQRGYEISDHSLFFPRKQRERKGEISSQSPGIRLWVLFTVLITVSACLKDDMLLIVSLTLSYTWSKHTLMGPVPFIFYFIVNGISSNIKWRMSAVWEKQKKINTHTDSTWERRGAGAARHCNPSWARQKVQGSERGKAHQQNTSCGNKQCPGHPEHSNPPFYLLFVKKGSPDTPDVLTHVQGGCEHSTPATAGVTHNSGSTHGWRYPVQTGWIVFDPGSPWGEIQGVLRNERSNGKPFPSTQMCPCGQGPCPDAVWADSHVLEKLCPKTHY